jgi:uncharacterized phiE125 gp8 family phage protein
MQHYNLVHTVKDITDQSGDVTEPITVEEVKSYMRLEGLQDVDESMATAFTEDDELIERLIVSARKKLETMYGISIVPKTLRAVLTNQAGDIEIPQGPVSSITSLKDKSGTAITDYTILGYSEAEEAYNDFIQLESPCYEKMVLIYEAGYDEVPEGLKDEILRMVTYWYENRGDKELKGFVFQTSEFNRNAWLA